MMTVFVRCAVWIALVILGIPSVYAGGSLTQEGQVNMEGSIITSACDITLESAFQMIEMGQDSVGVLTRTGYGKAQPFSIWIKNCTFVSSSLSDNLWQHITLTFDGAKEGELFKLNGGVSGIALQIIDDNDNPLSAGKPITYDIIDSEDIQLKYKIRLKATHGLMKLGHYSSVIKYRIDYY